jgi:hypothetical protein
MDYIMKYTTLVYILIALLAMFIVRGQKESLASTTDKTKCRKMAKKSLWKDYDFTRRILNKGEWKCPKGWENTGCTWDMGKEFEGKQCRRKKTNVLGDAPENESDDDSKKRVALLKNINKIRQKIKKLGGTAPSESGLRALSLADLQKRRDELVKIQLKLTMEKTPQPSAESAAADARNQLAFSALKGQKPTVASILASNLSEEEKKQQLAFSILKGLANIPVMTQAPETLKTSFLNLRCDDVDQNDMARYLVNAVKDTWPGAFAIATWVGKGGTSMWHSKKMHVECARNNGIGTRGYDVYIWAPGSSGHFRHLNPPGWANWALGGGKYNESWRSGPDKSEVKIQN